MKIDLAIVARDLKLPPEKIEKTVELLDAGNTIPFITRFRKDLTGGLNEQQILAIKQRVAQLRALSERKSFVLKSIESQGKLTEELTKQINLTTTSRRLEDLYLPFKPKKQSRASLARQQGLEPLSEDIFLASSPDVEIATRATEFVRVDKGLSSVDDVIKGVGDLLAERFSENDELRNNLRRIMWTEGKLTAQSVVVPEPDAEQAPTTGSPSTSSTPTPSTPTPSTPSTPTPSTPIQSTPTETAATPSTAAATAASATTAEGSPPASASKTVAGVAEVKQAKLENANDDPAPTALKEVKTEPAVGASDVSTELAGSESPSSESPSSESPSSEPPSSESVAPATGPEAVKDVVNPEGLVKSEKEATEPASDAPTSDAPASDAPASDAPASDAPASDAPASDAPTPVESAASEKTATETSATEQPTAQPEKTTALSDASNVKTDPTAAPQSTTASQPVTAPQPTELAKPKKKKKKKKKKPTEDPFKDYQDYKQPIKNVPDHRVLAINRGERAGKLRVKISVDGDKLSEAAIAALVPAEHPFREFLKKCAIDALNRMIVPSLEREIRRELTEGAEKHAVEVFANNLRNLLLQPPIRNRTVVVIDPGFKRGCSVAVLDPFGNVLDSGHVFVVGNQSRRDESKQKIANWVRTFKADVIAIGNGAACRQSEQMVSDTIAEQLQDLQTTYVMVNEAGASTYSTSEIGRTELPKASPSIRSAISIGRRLQDPLSELVKISPANIGVGMYQHDVKAKHLSESLDEVVHFCVNQVGVDVNSASPSLLKYVSGLNSLTARRVVEHRQANGRFKNRNQLKEISGFGEATFVQSAGFLRIHGGDTPLDCTSIHPESYEIANDILKRIDVSVDEFFPSETSTKPATETTSESAAEPASESAVEPATESVTEPTTEAATATEATAQAATEATAQAATDATVQPPTESSPSPAEHAPGADSAIGNVPATVDQSPLPSDAVLPEVVHPTKETPAVAQSASEVSAATSSPDVPVTPSQPESGTPTAETTVAQPAETTVAQPAETTVAQPAGNQDDRIHDSARRKEILKKISDLDIDELAQQHSAGKLLVKDILMALKRPKWDPRDKASKPIFRRGIIKADDLKLNMQLDGQVVNVVDFGVFVDIGLGESSLVHVSQLSNHFIRDPHRFYSVGDVLKVWVSEIDTERRRVKLTAVRPGSKKPQHRRGRTKSSSESSSETHRPAATGDSQGSTSAARKPGKYGNKYSGHKGKPTGRSGQRSSYGKSSTPHQSHGRRSKPKEVKPITDRMLKGDEPMRSFSDLAQFVNKKPQDAKKDAKDKNDKKDKDSNS